MDCSAPGLPVHHQLPEYTQTHVCWVGDAIQPSHPVNPFSSYLQFFPSIRLFSNESALRIRWPKYWRFSFNISPSNEHPGLISFRMGISLQSKGLSRAFSNTTVQKLQFFCAQLSQAEIEIMNTPITSTEIEAVIKNLPKKQKPRTRWLHRRILLNI